MIVFLFTITMIFPAGQSYLNFEGMIELGLKRGENETEERDLQALETIAVRSHWGIGAIRFAEMSEKLKDGKQGGEKLLDN